MLFFYHIIIWLAVKIEQNNYKSNLNNIPTLVITLFQTSSNRLKIAIDHNHDNGMQDLC